MRVPRSLSGLITTLHYAAAAKSQPMYPRAFDSQICRMPIIKAVSGWASLLHLHANGASRHIGASSLSAHFGSRYSSSTSLVSRSTTARLTIVSSNRRNAGLGNSSSDSESRWSRSTTAFTVPAIPAQGITFFAPALSIRASSARICVCNLVAFS